MPASLRFASRVRLLVLGALVPLLTVFLPAAEAPVSITPPDAYAARAAGLLTPLDTIRATPVGQVDKDVVAQVLLDETIHLVEADGRVLRVRQVVYRALTEAGVKPLGEDLFRYARDRQKFHLVRAATIHPDGTEQVVASDAILVQSPQRQADIAIYDDTTEVRVIYPRIQPGYITQAITVIEDTEPRMPGAYTSRGIWGGGWPVLNERWVVELPPGLAGKLRWFTIGAGASEPVREALPDGRVRFTWRHDSEPTRRYEVGRAPTIQTGPALQLTTLSDWDEVAAWFQGLLKDRDTLSPELAAQADEWIRSAPDRDALLRLLFTQVANEVRYTSLALGDGDYRPRSCSDVWTRRHGDCKDKSNLLVALLRHAGIPAHLALLNTTHLGLIDRRSPDFRVFTHAIVAIPDGRGGYTFCDPTIACALPGMLSPSDCDRDVLVIRDGRADWVRSAAQAAGRLNYDFDLSLNAAGEISGWLTLAAEGVYGAWERDRYRELDPPSRRDSLARIVRGFFPGAEIIDVVTPDSVASASPAVARAYFLVAGQTDASAGLSSLRFPRSSTLFLDLGTTERRDTAYFLYQDQVHVAARFKLPPGAASFALPSPFQVETPTGRAHARWLAEPGFVRAELDLEISQSSLPPREFPRFYQAMLALDSWLAQPLSLSAGSSPAAVVPVANIELPLMPTGAGQLELIEKRYPFSGDHALRRTALNRAVQYFPNDPATAYEAGVYLAVLDWDEDANQAALDRLDALLAAHRSLLSPDNIAWGDHIRALALRDLGRTDEALAVFGRISRDSSLDPWRRGQCALLASAVLAERDPAAAVEFLDACVLLRSEKQDAVLAELARLRLKLDHASLLRDRLAAISVAQPAALDGLLAHVTDSSIQWTDAGSRLRWLALAREMAPRPATELDAALVRADAEVLALAAAAALRDRLREAVAQAPLSAWFAADSGGTAAAATSWADYEKARQALIEKNDSDNCVRLGVRTFLALPADSEAVTRLWRIASDADWHERRAGGTLDYPIFDLLLDLTDLVPEPLDTHYEGRFLRGYRLTRAGKHDDARALFSALLADPRFPDSYRLSAYANLALACENLGDFPAALDAARPLEDHVEDSARNADRILRSVFINLHLDQSAEALRLVGVLEKSSEATLKKASGEYFIRELVELRRAGRAEAFWAGRQDWWPRWQKLCEALRLPPPGLETSVPVIPDLRALGAELGRAEAAKTPAAYWREFRTLVSAARWLPSLAPEISFLQAQAIRMAPAQASAFNQLVLAQLSIPGFPVENAALREFHLVASLFDSAKYPEALAAAAAFRGRYPATELQRPAVNRVWAMAARASGSELAEASAALEQDLSDPASSEQRPLTVELLANLYRARGLSEEETRLLARELANPVIIADANAKEKFTQRQAQLGGSVRLARHVTDWLTKNPLPWYPSAQPLSLEDPRLRNLDAVLDEPGRQFSPVETIKLHLLVAQDPDGGLARQTDAFRIAVTSLYSLLPTHAAARAFADSIIDDPEFDEAMRAVALWQFALYAYDHDEPDEFARLRGHPLAARFTQSQAALTDAIARFLWIDDTSPAALGAYAKTLLEKELSPADVSVLREVFFRYLRLDALDAARALADSIPAWRLDATVTDSRESLALDFARRLGNDEGLAPVHRALSAAVRAHFPSLPAQPPAAYGALRHRGALPVMAPDSTREAALWMIGKNRFERIHLGFWSTALLALNQDVANRQFTLDLIDAALRAAPDDEVRAQVLVSLCDSVDLDDATLLARLREIVSPYDNPSTSPECEKFLRLLNLRLALRQGEPVDLEASLDGLRDPATGMLRTRIRLRHYRQTGDLVSLKRTIQAIPTQNLLNPFLLSETVPSFALLGLKSELRLARETATRELRSAITTSWVTGDPATVGHALKLAEILADPSLLPAGWTEGVAHLCPDPMINGRVRITDAWLRADWPAVANAADELIRTYPTFYDFYWYAGAALHRAGKRAEARPYLEAFARYSKNEIEYPLALELLAAE